MEGDVVGPGAELAELDHDDLKASVEQQAAELEASERRLEALKTLAPIEMPMADAELAERVAERARTKRELERLEKLRNQDLAKAQQWEIAGTDHVLAGARAERAEVNLKQVRARFRTEISALEAQVEEVKAALRAAEIQVRWGVRDFRRHY